MSSPVGLSSEEAARRHAAMPRTAGTGELRSHLRIVLSHLITLFNLINFGATAFLVVFYLRTGDRRLLLDSVGIVLVTVANTVIAISSELRTVRKLRAIELLRARHMTVVRDGVPASVDRAGVVDGDVVLLHPGDQILIDGVVLEAHHLEVDESLLTGESRPVARCPGDRLRAGSFCVYGGGHFRAERGPGGTEAERMTALGRQYELRSSPLLRELNLFFLLSLGLTVLLAAVELLRDLERSGLDADAVRRVSTIVTSVIPEGLMFFATVTFALGILRMASRGVLVQQINALDRLPSVTAVCIDKTGTLTTSELEVTHVVPCCGEPEATGCGHLLAAFAAATSEPNATVAALARLDVAAGITPLDELPFRSELKMSAVRFAEADAVRTLLFGGFDVLAHRLSPAECERVETIFEREQLSGLRTLLLLEITEIEGPLTVETIARSRPTPLCIVAMSDRIRDDAASTLDRLAGEGVDVKILSGDAPDSVASVMGGIGWHVTEDQVTTGDAFHAMSAEARARAALDDRIFARLTPEQKREIVRALRDAGAQVAMIGDGMNDLIALKEADVGITMGEGIGSGDIILIERRFDLILACIAEGNRVIGTVVAVARLFLVKTLVIAALSALTWSGLVISPLTPRRGSLVSLLGVALPSYLVAAVFIGESGAHRVRERIIGFVLLSSAVIVLAGIVGGHLYAAEPGATPDGVAAGVMATLVLVSAASALCAMVFDDRVRRRTYLLVMALLLALYLPLVVTDVDAGPVGWVRTFYEIDPVPARLRTPAALVIAAASALLTLLQWIRHRRETPAGHRTSAT